MPTNMPQCEAVGGVCCNDFWTRVQNSGQKHCNWITNVPIDDYKDRAVEKKDCWSWGGSEGSEEEGKWNGVLNELKRVRVRKEWNRIENNE